MKAFVILAFFSYSIFAYAKPKGTDPNSLGLEVHDSSGRRDYHCFKKNDFIVAIFGASGPTGKLLSSGAKDDIKDANKEGLHIYLYILPCFQCGNARGQVANVFKEIQTDFINPNIDADFYWILVDKNGYWDTNTSSNTAFIGDMLDEIKKRGYSAGIYTSISDWTKITGNSNAHKAFPLWYIADDGQQSSDNFVPFGGWVFPFWKRYSASEKVCDVEVSESSMG